MVSRQWVLIAVILVVFGLQGAKAEVLDSAPNGFTSRNTITTAASAADVWQALTADIGHWWDPEHSFFGDAERFTLDPVPQGQWLEDAKDGRWVRHLEVVYADPGRVLRLRGGLGPLQGMAVTGALTYDLAPVASGLEISMTYAVGGYAANGLDALAPVVDGVLQAQLQRLAAYLQ